MLDPLLWNVMYNGVLVFLAPEGAIIAGFVDDRILVATTEHSDDVGCTRPRQKEG